LLKTQNSQQDANVKPTNENATTVLAKELQLLDSLMAQGLLNKSQVENITNKFVENAKSLFVQDASIQQNSIDNNAFFKQNGRQDVLNYLKNSNMNFDDDEIAKITDIVESVEKNAVESYLSNLKHGENIEKENALAKSKMTANAQNASAPSSFSKIFTRADIGKMSCSEFIQNEKLIMDQLRKGLIK
jgi:hypothetical protein